MMTLLVTRRVSGHALALLIAGGISSFPELSMAQTDPGARSGGAAAGGQISGLSTAQGQVFVEGQTRFTEVDNVPTNGLGPQFNSNSCVSCHTFPAEGGSSPVSNPQVAFANSHKQLPSFISASGPVREARFIQNPNGTPDGGVHSMFVITGRPDAPSGCNIAQDNFSDTSNIPLRIPTPTFGLGLIEAVSDALLEQNLTNTASARANLGIGGSFNRNGNDGSITRFG